MSAAIGPPTEARENPEALLQHELAVLNALGPRVTGVGQSAYTGQKLNQMDVHCRCDGKYIRRSGSAEFDDKVKMAREVRRRVAAILGSDVVDAAERSLLLRMHSSGGTAAAAVELSAADEQWIQVWFTEHAVPGAASRAEAVAALRQHKARQAGASTLGGMMERQRLEAKVRAAELRHKKSCRELEQSRQAVSATLPNEPAKKKGRTSLCAAEHMHSDPPEQYNEYTLLKFRELEAKEQARRAVQPSPSHLQRELPRGDASRGRFTHWRPGIHGALCSWAQGSLGAIVYMLARCAERYGVVDDLAEELGMLPKAEGERAKTCIYISERVRDALGVLKFCKSEEQRHDYLLGLALTAVRRTDADADPDQMYRRVANELNITAYRK